jgi:ABC-2 type transport system ATP-binding protein
MQAQPALTVTGLTKRYGSHAAVSDLTFAVPAGKVTGFLGPNGAGKTTTIRMILGLIRPTAGTALVDGVPFEALTDPASKIGVLIEGAQAHPGRTAHAHLRILAAERAVDPDRIDETLELVHLTDARNDKVRGFSLGMRQRLDLAAALLGEPDILILDEPANGLDPAGIRWLREFLRSFADRGGTVFVSSHQLAETAQLADEVVVIDRGRLVTHTTVDDLVSERIVRVRSPQIELLAPHIQMAGAEIVTKGEDAIELTGLAMEAVGTMAAAGSVVLHELSTRTGTLEDVFLDLTSQGAQP